ncbi:MAG: GNAT family N-acetyltransferase, partial [Planctomycetota bacterium]
GIGKALMDHVLGLERLVGMRRVLLATLDAHGLYEPHGFQPLRFPERFLERLDRRHYDGDE